MNMESDSPILYSESERMTMMEEVSDMKSLEPGGDNARADGPTDVNDFLDELSKEGGPQLGASDPGGDSDPSSDPESDDESEKQGRSNKKQRVFESQMPWFRKERRNRKSNTDPSCNKTRNILEILQRDPATIKKWIRCASTAPGGFPSTEWDAIVKGETVNLDTVFSSLHHIQSIDESVGRVGDTEIKFGRQKPVARVETSGQWTAAYNLVVKATAFLFPHRYEELRKYGDYIEELFSAKSTAIHPKLFRYDEAVRFKVGQGQNLLLTDKGEFIRYYEAIVAPDGVGIEGASGGSGAGPKKGGKTGDKPEICNRFNSAKGCSATADKCKYRHICKKCKQRGHGQMDCEVEKAV